MTSAELLRGLRKLAKSRGVSMTEKAGKGSHLKVQFGENKTIVPIHNSDLKKGTLTGILKSLGIKVEDL